MKQFPLRTNSSASHAHPSVRRLARFLGSLQLAVVLLPSLAMVLFLGTVVESRHGRPAAAQLVYRTWWFVALLALLAVNIFFAAAKKWPWKRHQTGFIITHIGLLTLIAGGVWDSVRGTTGSMALVTSADVRLGVRDPHRAGTITDRGDNRLRVRRPQRREPDTLDEPFHPGPLPWGYDGEIDLRTDRLTTVLSWLRDPRPAGWSRDLGDDAMIEVLTHLPHAKLEPYGSTEDVRGVPAVQFQLASPTTGLIPPRWVAFDGPGSSARLGPGRVDFVAEQLTPSALNEFLHPPSSPGSKGQVVVGSTGSVLRVDGNSQTPVQTRGIAARIMSPPQGRSNNPDGNVYVAVTFNGLPEVVFEMSPRRPGVALPRSSGRTPGDCWFWYHAPDARLGEDTTRALLQFATDNEGQLHFRSLTAKPGATCLREDSGRVDVVGNDWRRIWSGMDWRFRIVKYLPRARAGLHCLPVDRPAGAESINEPPAVRLRLRNSKAEAEFWVARTEGDWSTVVVGGERFEIGYHPTRHELGFELTLLRAEQVSEPGTGKPAALTSYVLMHDAPAPDTAHVISLNQPLAHRGYRVYQGAVAPVGVDESGKPAHRVQFLANRDPGVWLKYAGSSMVALGIACMFYMRAYFFKRPTGCDASTSR